jgi:hypothetical protein
MIPVCQYLTELATSETWFTHCICLQSSRTSCSFLNLCGRSTARALAPVNSPTSQKRGEPGRVIISDELKTTLCEPALDTPGGIWIVNQNIVPMMNIVSVVVPTFSSRHILWAGFTNQKNSDKLDRSDGIRVFFSLLSFMNHHQHGLHTNTLSQRIL